jgi:hypothetical protein
MARFSTKIPPRDCNQESGDGSVKDFGCQGFQKLCPVTPLLFEPIDEAEVPL